MSLNNLSYSDLQRRLDDPQQRDELVQLAREARPGRAARGGLLTREQRASLHCNGPNSSRSGKRDFGKVRSLC